MKAIGYWRHPTAKGTFYIRPINNRFQAMLEDESLGSYMTPQQAADDLAGGHTFSPSSGIDTSTLGLPSDVSDWEFVRMLSS